MAAPSGAASPAHRGPPADDICYATQTARTRFGPIAQRCDLLLVVGLGQFLQHRPAGRGGRPPGCRAELIEDAAQLELGWLDGASTIGLTAGASAPESLVQEVVDALPRLGPVTLTEVRTTDETVRFTLPTQVR